MFGHYNIYYAHFPQKPFFFFKKKKKKKDFRTHSFFSMSMSTDFTTILLRDFNNLLEEGVDHNVIIQVGEESNMKSFRAHSGILRARCPYFRTALSETWVK